MSHAHKQNMTVCSHKISKFKVKLAEEQHMKVWAVPVRPWPALLGVLEKRLLAFISSLS